MHSMKRELLMTKLMWLSEWVWEGYWSLRERKSVRKAECICLILSLMWMDHTLWEEIGLFFFLTYLLSFFFKKYFLYLLVLSLIQMLILIGRGTLNNALSLFFLVYMSQRAEPKYLGTELIRLVLRLECSTISIISTL